MSLALASCSYLPANGPQASTLVEAADTPDTAGFEVIDIDPPVIKALQSVPNRRFVGLFGGAAPSPILSIGVGDVVVVTIFEAAGGGLFTGTAANTGSHSIALPPQTVDQQGMISVPYGGRLTAAGQTPDSLARAVERSLTDVTVKPQALITITQPGSSSATVAGDVTGAAIVQLNIKGERLLEVIAQAGGVKAPAPQTFVRLTRGSRTATERLSGILENPAENVFIRPKDLIYVFSAPQTFTALGAVSHSGELSIDRANFTLAEALGVAGGLVDTQADTRGVFLFRFERPEVVRAIRPLSPLLAKHALIPVIYRLQLTGADAYFSAKAFPVRTEDLMFVSDAPTVEFQKFVTIIQSVASTARSIQKADPNSVGK